MSFICLVVIDLRATIHTKRTWIMLPQNLIGLIFKLRQGASIGRFCWLDGWSVGKMSKLTAAMRKTRQLNPSLLCNFACFNTTRHVLSWPFLTCYYLHRRLTMFIRLAWVLKRCLCGHAVRQISCQHLACRQQFILMSSACRLILVTHRLILAPNRLICAIRR